MSSTWLLMFLALGIAKAKPLTRRESAARLIINPEGGTADGIQDHPDDDLPAPGIATAKPLIRTVKPAGIIINPEGGTADRIEAYQNASRTAWSATIACDNVAPCQRSDGVLSDDVHVTTSTLTHATNDADADPNGRYCAALSSDKTKCEQEFSFKKCEKTAGNHTIYYPCKYNSNGKPRSNGTFDADKKCYAEAAYTAPDGVLLADGTRHAELCDSAGDQLFQPDGHDGEHCLGNETMDLVTKRCGAAVAIAGGGGGSEGDDDDDNGGGGSGEGDDDDDGGGGGSGE